MPDATSQLEVLKAIYSVIIVESGCATTATLPSLNVQRSVVIAVTRIQYWDLRVPDPNANANEPDAAVTLAQMGGVSGVA